MVHFFDNLMFGFFLGVLPIIPFFWLILLSGSLVYVFFRRLWLAGLSAWLLGFLLYPVFINGHGGLLTYQSFGTRLGYTISATLLTLLVIIIVKWIAGKFKFS